ncbi:hypothetical protein M9Y10_033017 [Tritrichomonas musculus]|uniref:Small GTP-binding protein n=1 Tax=Tritrichomonas musculus TaxID=1915356 RepID=A0ABR2GWZ7_9EUKA
MDLIPIKKTAKVILIGNSCVGKTSILLQLYKNIFDKDVEPTIGTSYITKIMQVSNKTVPLHIWDTAGQERFQSVIPMYMRGASAAVIVCATDSLESVQSLDKWYQMAQDASYNANFYVVLNKIDIESIFDPNIPGNWARDHNFKFYKTTAKDFENINQLFLEIAEDILRTDSSFSIQTRKENTIDEKTQNNCC